MITELLTRFSIPVPQFTPKRASNRSLLKKSKHSRSTFVVAWSLGCFIPATTAKWPPTSKDFFTRSYPLHYFLILILAKEPVFPFSMLSAKQGNYWYHFYSVFGMMRSLSGDWTGTSPTRNQHYTYRGGGSLFMISLLFRYIKQLDLDRSYILVVYVFKLLEQML